MADDTSEHWTIGRRAGRVAAIAAILVPAILFTGVAASGWYYDRTIRPATKQRVATFPAPGVETYIHAGARDPHVAEPRSRPDSTIVAAKRAIARDGLAEWGTR